VASHPEHQLASPRPKVNKLIADRHAKLPKQQLAACGHHHLAIAATSAVVIATLTRQKETKTAISMEVSRCH
jgi:hypothetical protein